MKRPLPDSVLASSDESTDRSEKKAKNPSSLQPAGLTPSRNIYMTEFHKAILEAHETAEGHIVFPSGALWPDMKSNFLFVRSFYKPCWEDILKNGVVTQKGFRQAAIVLGTAGIGKSAFALYAVYRAIRDNRTVIYDSAKLGGAIFKDGQTFILPERGLLGDFSDQNTLYVCDGKKPTPANGFTLLVTYPERAHFKETAKTGGTLELVFPAYDLPEILELRKLAFPDITEEVARERFHKWGGIPRHVLTRHKTQWQRRLESFVSCFTLSKFMSMVTHLDPLDQAMDPSEWVVHFTCQGQSSAGKLSPLQKEFYEFDGSVIGSQYMLEKILASLLSQEKQHTFSTFLAESAGRPLLAPLLRGGLLLERAFAIPTFMNGKVELACKPLELESEKIASADAQAHGAFKSSNLVEIPDPLPLVFFDTSAGGLRQKWESERGDAIFVPTAKNCPAVDFVLRVKGQPILVNSTVSENHSISDEGLEELLGIVSPRGEVVPFLWMSPKDTYDKIEKATPAKFAAQVAQFAVCLDVPDFSKIRA